MDPRKLVPFMVGTVGFVHKDDGKGNSLKREDCPLAQASTPCTVQAGGGLGSVASIFVAATLQGLNIYRACFCHCMTCGLHCLHWMICVRSCMSGASMTPLCLKSSCKSTGCASMVCSLGSCPQERV